MLLVYRHARMDSDANSVTKGWRAAGRATSPRRTPEWTAIDVLSGPSPEFQEAGP
jgi:hypothetical protein